MIDRSTRRIVCDTGPLISLEKLSGGYLFIQRLFDQLIVPPAVVDELAADLYESAEAYFRTHSVGDLLVVERPSIAFSRETQHLDLGERQAIALAIQLESAPRFRRFPDAGIVPAAYCQAVTRLSMR